MLIGNDNNRQKIISATDKVYVAIYDYDARTDEDLTFRVGDLLIILDDRFITFSSYCVTIFILLFFSSFLVKMIGGLQNIIRVD